MQKIYLIGDIHGSFKPVRDFYQRHIPLHRDINNDIDNVLICLGDFGGNFFFNHRDIEFKKKLGTYNLTYFVIRGNHEERPSICSAKNPDKWHTEEFWGNTVYVENKFPYIKYALDEVAFYYIPYVKIPYYLRDDNKETGDIEWEDLMDVYKTLVIFGTSEKALKYIKVVETILENSDKFVKTEDILDDVEAILSGKYDSVDESKFLYVGTLKELSL